jgi:hypothetical protein
MRRIQAIALACMVASPLALAQAPAPASAPASPAKMQLASKMYDINGVGTVFQGMEYNIMTSTMEQIGQGLGDKASCPALQQSAIQPQVQTFKGKLDGVLNSLSDAQFRQQASKVFADAYTEEEMKQIIAFMQSPAGQKMARMGGEINQRIGALAMNRAKTHATEIGAAREDFAKSIDKIASTCPATPPPAAAPKK